ncbi:MAG TPA: DUF1569 domain-containing protein [Ignavibacteria bacterium]|nr:DUF1569 domain-containing protein [Ignavibacteria bacterium]
MKSLYNSADNQEVIDRINKLSPESKAQWGKMNVSQMLAHADITMKSALGEIKGKRTLMGKLFGNMVKKKITSDDTPFKQGLPTDKAFVMTGNEKNFEAEKKNLIASVEKIGRVGANGVSKDPHPFFGEMTPQQWDVLIWKHLDHHLRQFGV